MALDLGTLSGTLDLNIAPLNRAAGAATKRLHRFRSDASKIGDAAGTGAGSKFGLGMSKTVAPATSHWGGFMEGFTANVASAGVSAAKSVASATIGMGLSVASGNEQALISFGTMLKGTGTSAKGFIGDLQKFAAKTPFEFPELQQAASSLISSGVEAKKVIPIMTTLGDVTSGMGTGAEGVKRATVALQQMQAAGRITGEDLNQLRDAGIPVYDLLAKATGKSKAEVVKLAQEGKLGKKELDAMMGALESGKGLERFRGLMDKQSQSLAGLWSTLKDTFGQGMATALQPVIPLLKDGMGGAAKALAGALPKVGAALKTAIEYVVLFVNALRTGFTEDEGTRIESIALAIRDGFLKVRDIAISLVPYLQKAWDVVLGLFDYLNQNRGVLVAIVAGIAAWKVGVVLLNAANAVMLFQQKVIAAGGMLKWIKGVITSTKLWTVGQWLLNAAMSANPIGIVIVVIAALVGAFIIAYKRSETFRNIVQTALGAVRDAALWLWEGAKTVFGHLVDAFHWVLDTAKSVWGAVVGAFEWARDGVKRVLDILVGALTWLRDAAKSVLDWITDHWKLIVLIIGGPIGIAVLLVVKYWDQIKAAFWAVVEWVKGFFARGWRGFRKVFIDPVLAALAWVRDVFWPKLKGVLSTLWGWVSGFFAREWRGFRRIFIDPPLAAWSWISGTFWPKVKGIFSSLWTWVSTTFKTAWAKLKGIVTKPLSDAHSWLRDTLLVKFKDLFTKAAGVVEKAWDKVRAAIKKPIKWVVDVVLNGGLIGAFNTIASAVGIPKDQQLSNIKLPKGFFRGGSTGDGDPREVAGLAHKGEHYATADEVSRTPGGHGTWERMRGLIRAGITDWLPGYASGGAVSPIQAAVNLGKSLGASSVGTYPGHDPSMARARDFMVGRRSTGDAIASSLWANRRALHIMYLIWWKRIISVARQSEGWRNYTRYGSSGTPSQMHTNHVHASFLASALSGTVSGALARLKGFAESFSLGQRDLVAELSTKFAPFLDRLKELGTSPLAQIVAKHVRNLAGGMLDKIKNAAAAITGPGPAGTGTPLHVGGNKAIVQRAAAAYGWNTGSNWNALVALINGESGFRNTAQNPTSSAYGMFQFLDSTWASVGARKTSDPWAQSVAGLKYISGSYGSPINAYAAWSRRNPHWYLDGTPSAASGFGWTAEKGAELVVNPQLRNFRGGEQVLDAKETKRLFGGGNSPLVGQMVIQSKGNVHDDMEEALWQLRRARRGGVYNSRSLAEVL